MGARVYLPGIGRFTQVDPIVGGTANNYVYVLDPINSSDYSGRLSVTVNFGMQYGWGGGYLQPAAVSVTIQYTASIASIQNAATITMSAVIHKSQPAPTITYISSPKNNTTRLPAATIVGIDMSTIPISPTLRADGYAYEPPAGNGFTRTLGSGGKNLLGFNLVGAVSSAKDWSRAGMVYGTATGCLGGSIAFLEPIQNLLKPFQQQCNKGQYDHLQTCSQITFTVLP